MGEEGVQPGYLYFREVQASLTSPVDELSIPTMTSQSPSPAVSQSGSPQALATTAIALAACFLWSSCVETGHNSKQAPPPTPPLLQLPAPVFPSLFANWESPHVHPIDLTADDQTLLLCNTAAHRIDVFDVSTGTPQSLGSVPVGLDPVSVRMRTDTEAWVANHLSDSISIIDLSTMQVIKTVRTGDEPTDIVFAGAPERAFVSCSQANCILVLDAMDPLAAGIEVPINGEDPRALAVSLDGSQIYAAVFESGNATTLLAGGKLFGSIPVPNVSSDSEGPYGGVNPPPNAPDELFEPSLNPNNPPPPEVALIVRKAKDGRWLDDNGVDWANFVSGTLAGSSGRVEGWDLPDRDVAVIDTSSLDVRYVTGCMNMCMTLAVQPMTGLVTVIGTEALNEIRFEPNVRGHFVRVQIAAFDANASVPQSIDDLNPHLDYQSSTEAQEVRDRSIDDPRAMVWNAGGDRAFVAGMGSNNVIVPDANLARVGRIEVGQGPTGIAMASSGTTAFVLNRFHGSISTIDTVNLQEVARTRFFDPTPSGIRFGRPFLYDTHDTSGLGQASCASCHVDARIDRLAWDLGDPSGEMAGFNGNCDPRGPACEDFHPMKGPMLTQTMQDIIGKEPFHWRGDRAGIEAFAPAYNSLLGDDEEFGDDAMGIFKQFLATVRFPPNPFRNLDNSLPTSLSLDKVICSDAQTPAIQGDATLGLTFFMDNDCSDCHTLPTGLGTGMSGNRPIPPGPNDELHHLVTTQFGFSNVNIKIPQLRNIYERLGMNLSQVDNNAGFGVGHDGQSGAARNAERAGSDGANLLAFLLSLSGSDLPSTDPGAPKSFDSHAAVGQQVAMGATGDQALLDQLQSFAAAGKVELIAKGQGWGWVYDMTSDSFFSDRNGETLGKSELRALASDTEMITYTVVPTGEGRRLGIDCDLDGYGDGTELELGSDPEDATDVPTE